MIDFKLNDKGDIIINNSEELKEYYLKTASEEDIKETGWK